MESEEEGPEPADSSKDEIVIDEPSKLQVR